MQCMIENYGIKLHELESIKIKSSWYFEPLKTCVLQSKSFSRYIQFKGFFFLHCTF